MRLDPTECVHGFDETIKKGVASGRQDIGSDALYRAVVRDSCELPAQVTELVIGPGTSR